MEKNKIPQISGIFKIIEMSDGIVIQQNDMVHTLNSTAFEILKLCDGKHTGQKIMDKMQTSYPDEDIEPVIELFLKQLNQYELIET